jgi:tryptophan-rich sensory protein
MNTKEWYSKLKKPSWSPPSYLFGPVWSILYIFIFISFGFVFYKGFIGDITFIIVLPFILNIIFNILFTPIQFRLRSNLLASIDILFMLITLIWIMVGIYPYYQWITYIQIPYLLWVSFAFGLQISITVLNWGRRD